MAATVGVVAGADVGSPPDADVAVGPAPATSTGGEPDVEPGGRTSRNTATAVPTSITSSAPRYRLNDGSALAGRRQSAQYVAFPWSSQYVLAQRLQAFVAGCSHE